VPVTIVSTPPDPCQLPWRVGRKVPRNLYAMVGEAASDDDLDIGRMDTPELAQAAAMGHNAALAAIHPSRHGR
jgi:hypothetical protein